MYSRRAYFMQVLIIGFKHHQQTRSPEPTEGQEKTQLFKDHTHGK